MFLTPERREALDRERQSGIRKEASGIPMSLDGVLTRSSGRGTVWINGFAQEQDGSLPDNPAARIAVGDTLDPDTGETTDLLNGGKIQVKTAPRQ